MAGFTVGGKPHAWEWSWRLEDGRISAKALPVIQMTDNGG